jgi:hypothetical protein
MGAPAQWQDSVLVIAPDNGRFCKTKDEAVAEMQKHRDLSISDLSVIPTNATVLTASWYAGKRDIVTNDETTNQLLKRLESDQKVFAQLNKKRVEKAKLREMIAEGVDAADFTDYMRQAKPNFSMQSLDEQDEQELMTKYHEFKLKNKIYSNDDKNFVTFVKQQLPYRNLDTKPLTLEERKTLSAKYVESHDVPELSADSDAVALDFYEMGGDVPNQGVEHRREYAEGQTPYVSK